MGRNRWPLTGYVAAAGDQMTTCTSRSTIVASRCPRPKSGARILDPTASRIPSTTGRPAASLDHVQGRPRARRTSERLANTVKRRASGEMQGAWGFRARHLLRRGCSAWGSDCTGAAQLVPGAAEIDSEDSSSDGRRRVGARRPTTALSTRRDAKEERARRRLRVSGTPIARSGASAATPRVRRHGAGVTGPASSPWQPSRRTCSGPPPPADLPPSSTQMVCATPIPRRPLRSGPLLRR